MSSPLAALRFVWLLAVRDLVRAPRRSGLLVTVIAVPGLSLSAAATVLATTALSPQEQVRYTLGASDYVLYHRAEMPEPSPLPGETRRVTETISRGAVVDTAGVRHPVNVTDLPAGEPLVREVTHLLAGRLPARGGEVAVSPALLQDQRLQIGGVLALDLPAAQYTVVGVAQDPLAVHGRQLLLPPGAAGSLDPGRVLERRHYLQGTDLDVAGLPERGVRTVSRAEAAGARGSALSARDRAAATALTLLATVVVCAARWGSPRAG